MCLPQSVACVILLAAGFVHSNSENFQLNPENMKELFGLGFHPCS